MRHRLAAASLALALTVVPALDAAATVQAAQPKRCYAKKHGKRVRVKCPKKRAAPPRPPASKPPPVPQNDPALAAQWNALLIGQMLHRFSTSASHSELLLHLCAGGGYQYIDFGDTTGTASDNGAWRVTGAERTPPGITLGLLLSPANGSPARFLVLQLTDNGDGTYTALAGADRWYLSTSSLCPPG